MEESHRPRAGSQSNRSRLGEYRTRAPARQARGRRLLLAALATAVATSVACSSPVIPAEPLPKRPKVYRVGAPDQLLVSILPEPVIERGVVVRPDGRISVDLIGDIDAANRTTEEIAAEIQQRISRFKRDAVVTVSVVAALSSTVTVFGQVGTPGTVVLDREKRLAEAIGALGGPNIFASEGRVRIIRSNFEQQTSQILLVNLRHIQAGDQRTNYLLHDGDIVVVPPNALARIGFTMQTLLFPFQPILSAGSAALLVSRGL